MKYRIKPQPHIVDKQKQVYSVVNDIGIVESTHDSEVDAEVRITELHRSEKALEIVKIRLDALVDELNGHFEFSDLDDIHLLISNYVDDELMGG